MSEASGSLSEPHAGSKSVVFCPVGCENKFLCVCVSARVCVCVCGLVSTWGTGW